MRPRSIALFLLLLLFLCACQAPKLCPEGSVTYAGSPAEMPALTGPAAAAPTPSMMEIAGKMVEVDRVIRGPVCNDTWKGTIYVACDVQLLEWDKNDKPLFFEGCNLTVEPDTTVYVAAHQYTAYYNGCSCHTSAEP